MKGKWFKNEKGVLNIELIGLLPFIILLFVILIQVIVTGYSIFMAQNIVNESAKAYSITEEKEEAWGVVEDSIASSCGLEDISDLLVHREGEGNNFTMSFDCKHNMLIGPDSWRGELLTTNHEVYSRVLK